MVAERQPLFANRLYEILFERHPEVRALFGDRSIEAHAKIVTRALVAVMDHLDDATWFTQTLAALGAKHAGFVTDAMYDWAGDALLATLAEVAGDDWSPALASEWATAYGAIAATMQSGAPRVSVRAA
jgi:hemoglobin-like flavoprotein